MDFLEILCGFYGFSSPMSPFWFVYRPDLRLDDLLQAAFQLSEPSSHAAELLHARAPRLLPAGHRRALRGPKRWRKGHGVAAAALRAQLGRLAELLVSSARGELPGCGLEQRLLVGALGALREPGAESENAVNIFKWIS